MVKLVEQFRRYWADTIGHMDRITDGQTDKVIPIYPLPPYKWVGGGGVIKDKNYNWKIKIKTYYFHTCISKANPRIQSYIKWLTSMRHTHETFANVCFFIHHNFHPLSIQKHKTRKSKLQNSHQRLYISSCLEYNPYQHTVKLRHLN